MGIQEIVLLQAAQQLGSALGVFCTAGAGVVSNALGKVALQTGAKLAANLTQMANYGLLAATKEFNTQQAAEAKYVADSATIPLVT